MKRQATPLLLSAEIKLKPIHVLRVVILSVSEAIQYFSADAVWIASAYAQVRFGGHGRSSAPRNDAG